MPQRPPESETQTLTRPELKTPEMYRVLLLNDDYTPMDFVVDLLIRLFHRSALQANRIMLAVHHKGSGVAGVYPREIAETKVHQATELARKAGHPLRCVMEEDI
ncbi:ATP-dependent Clp protease adaptor protein ClpS [Deinobacterium chartae]|uniref:ATP-dependent Clp protease adapter protein ClpS n=1 Tax=Deinobacterium chartae TaxID=521158 RepID=A0A841I4Y0_9DEIO|nr:ATP-dependent Clp protease adapter ClpS [Deinobacterium chartae]MBB6100076.1 ATP-dependent Clp protease adaptor protein ClpS [Deinobacterium chartae]